jgi:hypothetical protein
LANQRSRVARGFHQFVFLRRSKPFRIAASLTALLFAFFDSNPAQNCRLLGNQRFRVANRFDGLFFLRPSKRFPGTVSNIAAVFRF